MPDTREGSAALWFERAARCHVERHQGCPWCGASHCVFRSPRQDRVEYACYCCDFFACHNHLTGRYYATPGRAPAAEPSVA